MKIPFAGDVSLAKFGAPTEYLGWNGKLMTMLRGSADSLGLERTGFDLGLGSLIALLTAWNAWKVYQGFRKGEVNIGSIIVAWISIGIVFGKPDSIIPIIIIFATLFTFAKQAKNHHDSYWGERDEKWAAKRVGRTGVGRRLRRWGHRLRRIGHMIKGVGGKKIGKLGNAMVGVSEEMIKVNAEQLHMQMHMDYMSDALLGSEKELKDGLTDDSDYEKRIRAILAWVSKVIQAVRQKLAEFKSRGEINTNISLWGKQISLKVVSVLEQEAEIDNGRAARLGKSSKMMIRFAESLNDALRLFVENVNEMKDESKVDRSKVKEFFNLLIENVKKRQGLGNDQKEMMKQAIRNTEKEFNRVSEGTWEMIRNDRIKPRANKLRAKCSEFKEALEHSQKGMEDARNKMHKSKLDLLGRFSRRQNTTTRDRQTEND